jgi:hypothetical protein
MQARVETALDGGTVEIVYTTDPKYIDGLTLSETVETVLGLIPALLFATTHIQVPYETLAEIYRDFADIYDPPEDTREYVSVRSLMDEEDSFLEVQRGPIEDYTYYEGQH